MSPPWSHPSCRDWCHHSGVTSGYRDPHHCHGVTPAVGTGVTAWGAPWLQGPVSLPWGHWAVETDVTAVGSHLAIGTGVTVWCHWAVGTGVTAVGSPRLQGRGLPLCPPAACRTPLRSRALHAVGSGQALGGLCARRGVWASPHAPHGSRGGARAGRGCGGLFFENHLVKKWV